MKKEKLLSLGLITSTTLTTLSGCSKEEPTRTYEYVTQEDGSIEFEGKINYSEMISSKVILLKFSDNSINYYISSSNSYDRWFNYHFVNIKNGKQYIYQMILIYKNIVMI